MSRKRGAQRPSGFRRFKGSCFCDRCFPQRCQTGQYSRYFHSRETCVCNFRSLDSLVTQANGEGKDRSATPEEPPTQGPGREGNGWGEGFGFPLTPWQHWFARLPAWDHQICDAILTARVVGALFQLRQVCVYFRSNTSFIYTM